MTAHPGPEEGRPPARRPARVPACGRHAWLTSLALHVAGATLLLVQGGPRLTPAPRVVVPLMLPSVVPTSTPRPLPRVPGDLAVRPGATPSPTPTPATHPSPRPTVRPTARPTVRPTARPTARPTSDPEEQQRFAQMRRIPYFATMTDAQLRQQRLPPGLKDWGEVAGVTRELDGLNWRLLPPETGADSSPGPDAAATDALLLAWLSASDTVLVPSPTVEVDPEGHETSTWRSDTAWIQVEHQAGNKAARVRLSPDPLGTEPAGRELEVPWDPDPLVLRRRVVEALRSLASPSPTPGP
ncbi:MAG: hypothetical protein VKQ33_05315 [Candidatus Sericytochromatia bacterium]|nr:hypothetical protein [Candidatus Sericytochromatia bacterium]